VIVFRPSTAADAEWVGSRLREADATEVQTVTGETPLPSVLRAFALSTECYSIYRAERGRVSEKPCALFGVVPDERHAGYGIVWFLATDDIRGAGISLLREADRWLDAMCKPYPLGLHNLADMRNTLHIRWCVLSGFVVTREPQIIGGFPFQYIHRPARSPSSCASP
jgi:hypothetical protein